jgi:hypothetical protein
MLVICILGLLVVAGCSADRTLPSTPVLFATATPKPTPTLLPTPTPFPPCDSSQFMVPTTVITSGIRADGEYPGSSERFDQRPGWLSIHVDVDLGVVQYAEPIPMRVTVTNERKDQSVIFARPQYIWFKGATSLIGPNLPSGLIIDLVSTAGDRIKPAPFMGHRYGYDLRTAKDFSMLQPGDSCSMDWPFTDYDEDARVPPGNYQMKVILHAVDLGPELWNTAGEIWDVDAWIGITEPSNVTTFTVLPEEK